jgi:hypothetical protein
MHATQPKRDFSVSKRDLGVLPVWAAGQKGGSGLHDVQLYMFLFCSQYI